jgi:hypothetical protein
VSPFMISLRLNHDLLLFITNLKSKPKYISLLYNYINESASTNSLNMWAIYLSCPVITTSSLDNAKKIKWLISVIWFHFKFHFHHFILHDEMHKTRSHLHMFWRIFKSKTIWIKFLIFSNPKIIPYFYFPFRPTSIPSPIFLAHLILSAIFFRWASQ